MEFFLWLLDKLRILGMQLVLVQNIKPSVVVVSLLPCEGVRFSLRGTTYQNNSLVSLEDIGEGYGALLCMTDQPACCRPSYIDSVWLTAFGNWFFPNGTRVPSSGNNWDMHRTRGHMVLPLHRRKGGTEGIYHCVILDAMNVSQTIYIGVYPAETGEWYM